jgi:IS4 transposase
MNSDHPKLGPPAHYIHVIWLAAFANDPQEYYDELDATRWSLRCVRLYRDGTSKAFGHESPNWRDGMPEAAIDEPPVINRDTQFRARAISRDEPSLPLLLKHTRGVDTPFVLRDEPQTSTYRLRWRIELAFKRLKSLIGLEGPPGKDPRPAKA